MLLETLAFFLPNRLSSIVLDHIKLNDEAHVHVQLLTDAVRSVAPVLQFGITRDLCQQPRQKGELSRSHCVSLVDLRTFDEVVWSATYPSETDV
jgi:hypothetical protein